MRGKIPVDMLEFSLPHVATELTGKAQMADSRAMPLAAHVAEVMHWLKTQDHPKGEVLVAYGRDRRTAEREGHYDARFAAMNPT